jgi:DNA-binding response OmpR family regulator
MTSSDDKITVLVADDETPIRLLVRVNLEAEGFVVIEASDGSQAVDMAFAELPDVVLLDVMMPRKDGWQAASELLADERTARTPVVFLTARADLRDHERGLHTGALQYITKPFNPRDLAPTLIECVRAARAGESDEIRAARLDRVRELQSSPE